MRKITFVSKQPAFWVGLICSLIILFDLASYSIDLSLQASLYQMSIDFMNQREIAIKDFNSGVISLEQSFLKTDAAVDSLIDSLQPLKTAEESSDKVLNTSNFYQKVFGEGLVYFNLNQLEEELIKERSGQKTESSIFKEFVTPNDPTIVEMANKIPEVETLYLNSQRNWVWSSDSKLWHKEEKWLLPKEFLTAAPKYKGKPLSDCEEQANTFLSLLRALDVEPENVRVALGLVRLINIKGESDVSLLGGHVWVELFKDDKWIILDPSNGPAIDDKGNFYDFEILPFDFFKFHVYPAHKVIAYYNDKYFYDIYSAPQNIPAHWYYYNFEERSDLQ